jgi:hypothetical protein
LCRNRPLHCTPVSESAQTNTSQECRLSCGIAIAYSIAYCGEEAAVAAHFAGYCQAGIFEEIVSRPKGAAEALTIPHASQTGCGEGDRAAIAKRLEKVLGVLKAERC